MMHLTDLRWNSDALDPTAPPLSEDDDLGVLSRDELEEWRLCVHLIRSHAYMHRSIPSQARHSVVPTALLLYAAWWDGPNWLAYLATGLAALVWLHLLNVGYAIWRDRHNRDVWIELENFCFSQAQVIDLLGHNTGRDRQTFAFIRRTLRLFREINLSPVDVDAGP